MNFPKYVVLLFALAPVIAHAQKPTLVQNVDEQGRVPYHETRARGLNASQPVDCSGSDCNVVFTAVPAGYRLVVTFVSVQYTAVSPAVESMALLIGTPATESNNYVVTENVVYLPAATPDAFHQVVWGQPILLYVEAGATPTIYARNIAAGSATFTLAGYLIKL